MTLHIFSQVLPALAVLSLTILVGMHMMETRRKLRRLSARIEHEHRMMLQAMSRIAYLEVFRETYEPQMQAMRTPSARRVATAHLNAITSAELERQARSDLPTTPTQRID